MLCPFCSHEETKVLESRLVDKAVRRRRECLDCSARFTTYEKAIFNFTVIKKDSREQPFQLEKIKNSILRACGKIEEEPLQKLTRTIEQKILAKKTNLIKTTDIGKIVLRELRKFDKIAYLRFATIHKELEDPKLVEKELHLIA